MVFPLVVLLFLGGAGSQRGLPEVIRHHLDTATQAEKSRDYKRAAEAYRRVLGLVPDAVEIHQKLGLALHLDGNYLEAIDSFAKALSLDPKLSVSHLFQGIAFYKTNQFPRAVPVLKNALAAGNDDIRLEARFWLGVTYLALGNHLEAIKELQQIVETYPDRAEALYQLIQAHREYAAALLQRIVDDFQDSSFLHQLRAERHKTAGRIEPALEEYQLAVSRDPERPGLHSELAELFLQLGQKEKAAEAFRRELQVNPFESGALAYLQQLEVRAALPDGSNIDSGKILMLRGISGFHERKYEEAALKFREAWALGPPHEKESLLYYARCLAALGRREESVETGQDLLERFGPRPEVLYTVGSLHGTLAENRLSEMVRLAPDSYRVHQMLGEVYEREERYQQALESYRRAFTLSPDTPGIRFSLGSVHWKMRNFDEAVRWLKEELGKNPHHTLAQFQLADILGRQGNFTAAVRYLEKVLAARPEFAEAHREMGKALSQLGEYEGALRELRWVAEANSEDETVHALLASLYQKLGRLQEAQAELELHQQLTQKRLQRVQEEFQKPSQP